MEEKGFKDVIFFFNGKTRVVKEEEWKKWRYKYSSPSPYPLFGFWGFSYPPVNYGLKILNGNFQK